MESQREVEHWSVLPFCIGATRVLPCFSKAVGTGLIPSPGVRLHDCSKVEFPLGLLFSRSLTLRWDDFFIVIGLDFVIL